MAKVLIGNFKGPKGETGEKGTQGETGATGSRGSKWFNGTGITGTSTTATVFAGSGLEDVLEDDYYLNTATGNTYRCTLGGASTVAKWVYIANIKGPQGESANEDVWKEKLDATGDGSNTTVVFSQSSKLENITSGEKQSTLMGKIMKAIREFIDHKDTKGTASVAGHLKIGMTSDTACAGNDARLSDERAPKSHDQSASTITGGTFKGEVIAAASTDISKAHVVNHVTVDTKPTVGDATTFPIGTYIHVKK